MKWLLVFLFHSTVILGLTVVSQIGGVVYLVCLLLARYVFHWSVQKQVLLFFSAYTIAIFLIVPKIALYFEREPLPIFGNSLRPLTMVTYVLNRHYVHSQLKEIIEEKASLIARRYPGTVTYYLDANFPFINGFPLIPHLSHKDGKKIDLAFYYKSKDNKQYVASSPSWIGYGVYDAPKLTEVNWPERCGEQGYWQYSATQYLVPSWSEGKYEVEEERTRFLLQSLAKTKNIQKVFLEPHLAERWGISSLDKIRFHGCHAVRHDDHIHVQIH
uniref:Uncharacterized protein n=1 Tax=Roseihalotalea indica TaxID=2867963 RepID=A0AA49JHE8_9BACT|nr:hypothetical protein K4G66_05425 [Tunicatimonas sp. TK19036]